MYSGNPLVTAADSATVSHSGQEKPMQLRRTPLSSEERQRRQVSLELAVIVDSGPDENFLDRELAKQLQLIPDPLHSPGGQRPGWPPVVPCYQPYSSFEPYYLR
ncbi:unnamed protein product [Pleuronectes platessa]|uniref:Uncharacterized protein n=1 Tax=Pleuronectes platessa TaxID=8262 RepID=A0A9N7Y752_PLEPL|nr:unnamed protein product [Pleuronectes platessa]